ncbi:MAG: hypothetical protein PHX18_02140 [Candidatus Gastranaerophilales bacterium]|nr:hypothetical protein [Candidatus Gastranaerophilales bacterium]
MIQAVSPISPNAICGCIGANVQMPVQGRNYCIFDENLVDGYVRTKDTSLPYLINTLAVVQDEKAIAEGLYIADRMIDAGVNDMGKYYHVFARFNNTNSPVIQTFLAGIYRKTKVPDAFGPLLSMLMKNTFSPKTSNFDPNEEIGGAILDYLKK